LRPIIPVAFPGMLQQCLLIMDRTVVQISGKNHVTLM
jgi:hypothetical protein